jgi:hypothetical protein
MRSRISQPNDGSRSSLTPLVGYKQKLLGSFSKSLVLRSAGMVDHPKLDLVAEHNQEVGLLCTQWAYLEWLLELALWWLLGLLNQPREGRILTGGLSIDTLARRVSELSSLRIGDANQRATLGRVRVRITDVLDERNLAIHGVRSLQPDDSVLAAVSRGKYKNEPQRMSLIRLRSLNSEVARILAELEPLLFTLGVIEGVTEISRRYKSDQQP